MPTKPIPPLELRPPPPPVLAVPLPPVLTAAKREQVEVIAAAVQANLVLDTLRRLLDVRACERIAAALIESATLPGKAGHADRRLIFELQETDEDRRKLLSGVRRKVELVFRFEEDVPRPYVEGQVKEIKEADGNIGSG